MPDFTGDDENLKFRKIALRNRMITFRQSLTEPARTSAAVSIQEHLCSLLRPLNPATDSSPGGRPAFPLPTTQAPAGVPPDHTAIHPSLETPTSPFVGAPAIGSGDPITVAAYVPVGREPGGPDLPEALASALPPGSRLLLPVLLDDGDLDWALYEGPTSLRPGPRGLREPAGHRLGVGAIREADLVLVPALAVDHSGMRLGRGGGSYDRALARAGSAFTVALLHDGEVLDSVPAAEHDRPVRAVITPGGGVALSADSDWTK